MTIRQTPFNSITPVETPTMVGDRFIDGYLDGQPVVIQRLANGMHKTCEGTRLHLPYGTGKVVGYTPDNRLIMKVTQFNEDFEFVNADGTDVYCAEEYVAKLSSARNIGIEHDRRRFTELYKSDITDKLTATNAEKMERMYPFTAVDEVVVNLSNYPLSDEMVHVTVIPTEKERKEQAEKRRALEVAEALRLRRELLAKYSDDECPDEVSADIADAFGE